MTDTAKYRYDAERQDYLTPPKFINEVLSEIGRTEFDLDTCCKLRNIPAKKHFIFPDFDGLKLEWSSLNWCNPPYKFCDKWVKKAYQEQKKGHKTIMLIPARTETKYFHDYILNNKRVQIKFLRKGLKFINPLTFREMGIFKNALALIYFK